jgi:mono/diheme cytochrome c family protein
MKDSNSNFFLVFAVLVTFTVVGCAKDSTNTSALYVPTTADVTANATLEELQQGRALYIDNCGSCHGLYSPDDYSASQWHSIMNSMAPRTHMSAAQISLVTKYVTRGK